MTLNEKDVLKQAKENPEELSIWQPEDIINMPLTMIVLAEVLAPFPLWSTETVWCLFHNMRSELYKENIQASTPRVPILEKPLFSSK
ncbi:hypothetical protein J3458_022133 [Metarhizium acridum]|uniref:uncharacterized protein n=1 Tax=Metarhizium acridum TaxID=92637 RepID=UPI001C6B008D|nr:hypothetical protein J3458_022133 [Metarhizium acridum]